MKAIILIGGYATRLHPLNFRTPKCLLPVNGNPNIDNIIESVAEAGIKDVIISMQEKVKMHLGDGKKYGVKINYIVENTQDDKTKLGSIGALKFIFEKIEPEDCIILGGDQYFEKQNIANILKEHQKSKKMITLALYKLKDESLVERMGIAVTNESGKLLFFQEKPKLQEAKSRFASTLIYVINKEFFRKHINRYIEEKKKRSEKLDNIGELWSYFASVLDINTYQMEGEWWDIGTPTSFLDVNSYALREEIDKDVQLGKNVNIAKHTRIDKGCKIGDNCTIGPYTHIMKNVIVGDGCAISSSIVFENTKIGNNTKINRSVVDYTAEIGNNINISEESVVGYRCIINDNCELKGSRLWPNLILDKNCKVEGIIKTKIVYE